MSTTYYAWTFAVRTLEIPPDLFAMDDLDQVYDWMNGRDVLWSGSRNDWLTGALSNCIACFGSTTLKFLDLYYPRSSSTRLGDYQEHWLVSKLHLVDIPNAIAEIDQWLVCALTHPDIFVGTLAHEASGVLDAVRQATSDREDPSKPHFPMGEDDGDGPTYFFSFLKCLRVLLEDARMRGMSVLHVRCVYC